MPVREKGGTSRPTAFFQWCMGPEGQKVRSLKQRAEPAGQMRDEKLHAVVAWRTFPSQKRQNTPWSDHVWQLRCQKSARPCGLKQISKWKCRTHTRFRPLLELEMSKKCMPLGREAHFEVQMYKTRHAWTTDVAFRKSVRRCGAKHILKWKCKKTHHAATLDCIALQYITLNDTAPKRDK